MSPLRSRETIDVVSWIEEGLVPPQSEAWRFTPIATAVPASGKLITGALVSVREGYWPELGAYGGVTFESAPQPSAPGAPFSLVRVDWVYGASAPPKASVRQLTPASARSEPV